MQLPDEYIHELNRTLAEPVRVDEVTKLLYSTDASIYQIEPFGVVFPRSAEELIAVIEISARYRIPILPRGSGSSLAGQAIGPAVIIDCSRYLNQVIEINPEDLSATVEPGVIMTLLNKQAASYGLQFGPDPASAERATMGGSISNNATGAHSIIYGMSSDHLLSVDVVLSDGSTASISPIALDIARGISNRDKEGSRLAQIYAAALDIRDTNADAIRAGWPQTWRCASGYNLHYLLPWSASCPPYWGEGQRNPLSYPPVKDGSINLAPLIAGSEGTLAVIRQAKVRLVPKPRYTCLGILSYTTIAEACEATPELMDRYQQSLSAVELVPQSLVRLAGTIPGYARQAAILERVGGREEKAGALLVVEFAGNEMEPLVQMAGQLRTDVMVADSPEVQKQIWGVRKVGLGILYSRPGDIKPISIIEDFSVPVDRLSEYVRELDLILAQYGTEAEIYAHASAGCLHIRPLLNLKGEEGVRRMRSIAQEAVDLLIRMRGALSGEHGVGIARGEWLERVFGADLVQAFRQLKLAADPYGLLNPGKIVSLDPARHPFPMDEQLRFGPGYRTDGWSPAFNYLPPGLSVAQRSQDANRQAFASGIEMCNGAGVCRKLDGVMCPSFQATHDEMHSTRGRANLLRALISGRFSSTETGMEAVREALDLCLACKACKAECPSGVDVAKLKYEFYHQYYTQSRGQRRPLRDYLFGYIEVFARIGHPFAPLANLLLSSPLISGLGERTLGLSRRRTLPRLERRTFSSLAREKIRGDNDLNETILLLNDAFTEYFYPQTGLDALETLQACGSKVRLIPVLGAGRTFISKGLLDPARRHAFRLLKTIREMDPQGIYPVVGIEPSEIYTVRDEFLDLFLDEDDLTYAQSLARRAWMIDEFLVRPAADGKARNNKLLKPSRIDSPREVYLHGHCYQKAQPPADDGYPSGVSATQAMLEAAGFQVNLIEAGCCGMAGAFGYESEHYELSMKIGDLGLLPAVRDAGVGAIIAASGVSCQAQIKDGTGREAVHPISLVRQSLGSSSGVGEGF